MANIKKTPLNCTLSREYMINISRERLCVCVCVFKNDQLSRMTLLPGVGMGNRERTGDGGSFASHITWRHFKIIYLFVCLLFGHAAWLVGS